MVMFKMCFSIDRLSPYTSSSSLASNVGLKLIGFWIEHSQIVIVVIAVMAMFVCLFVCLSVCLFVCLFVQKQMQLLLLFGEEWTV